MNCYGKKGSKLLVSKDKEAEEKTNVNSKAVWKKIMTTLIFTIMLICPQVTEMLCNLTVYIFCQIK